jgi:hypothetical protein
MAKVRNSESPVITRFGGICCVPSAVRVMLRTTEILVNEVAVMIIAGRNDSAVISKTTFIEAEIPEEFPTSSPPIEIDRSGSADCAIATVGATRKRAKITALSFRITPPDP